MNDKEMDQLTALVKTMRHLRSPEGCPWDREQTPESLRPYILEEAYELVDAIDSGDTSEILAELGDLLLQVIFQAQIYSERGLFGIGEVAEGIDQKLQRRHPQLFDYKREEPHPDWEQIKQQELREKGKETDYYTRQPVNLPALKLADKCCRQLRKTTGQERLTEILPGHKDQIKVTGEENIAAELFNLVNQAQQQNIDADLALRNYVLNLFRKEDKNGHK
jgi:MazG family protein